MDKKALAERIARIFFYLLPWWDFPWDSFDDAVNGIISAFEMQEDTMEIMSQLSALIEDTDKFKAWARTGA